MQYDKLHYITDYSILYYVISGPRLKASRRSQDKRGRRRGAASPTDEPSWTNCETHMATYYKLRQMTTKLSWDNVGNKCDNMIMATCGSMWQTRVAVCGAPSTARERGGRAAGAAASQHL